MQPVEKKSKQPSSLKTTHVEHCGRLQLKYQQDSELLEDLRFYVRQRAVIEKLYAQSLCKLAQQLISKRQVTSESPASANTDPRPNKRLDGVWRCVLEETDRVGKTRIEAAESYLQRILEDCKQIRTARSQAVKTVLEQLSEIQKEVSSTVHELNKSQKVYRDEQHVTNEARVKAASANAKLKNKSTGRFTSLTKLQQQHSKCHARWESCETRSTEARNQYLLNLAATNSHLMRYYNTDLPELLKILDGDYYERFKDFISSLAKMEQSSASVTNQCFERVLNNANTISRDYSIKCFLEEKPILSNVIQYQFEPQDNDEMNCLSCEHGAELALNKEARKWASKVARESQLIRQTTKDLNSAIEQRQVAKTVSGSGDAVSSSLSTLEAKCDELHNVIRKAETAKLRANARLDLLRQGGVNVDEWLNDVNIAEDDQTDVIANGRRSPSISAKSDTSSEREPVQFVVDLPNPAAPQPLRRASFGITETVQQEVFTATEETIPEECTAIESYPVWCVVIYDYQAVNPDELTIREDESLELIGAGDGDGWLKARNNAGVEGLVPVNYIRVWNPVDEAGDNDDNEVNVDDIGHDQYSDENVWAKAVYDYTATSDEELSFTEGQLIQVKSKEPNGVDDGWWVGEINGTVGVFPSLMVIEMTQENHFDNTIHNGSHDDVNEEYDPTDTYPPASYDPAEYQHEYQPQYHGSSSNNEIEYNEDMSVYHGMTRSTSAGGALQPASPGSAPNGGPNARSVLDLHYLFKEGAESCV